MEIPNSYPTVSIILRNRNEAEFLPVVLESIRKQRCVRTETIFVDNEPDDKRDELAKNRNIRSPSHVSYC